MQTSRVILIKYGELGLKGANRSLFEKALKRHVAWALSDMPDARVKRVYGRLFVEGDFPVDIALERLSKVPGIVEVNKASKTPSNMDVITQEALASVGEALEKIAPASFKVETRRQDKNFPFTSPEINGALGGAILDKYPQLTVDVHSPDLTLRLEVRDEGTYIYWQGIRGPGGLPIGTSGKGVLLLSGGIDSPVAGYLAMKRGVSLAALHFWSYPITGERAKDKVVDLARKLKAYDPHFRLHIAHFTDIQTAIMEKCPERFRVTIMRRMMMRVASGLAEKAGAKAIFTGENIGQVASQTLESLTAIEDAASLPVLRPLICFDKAETTELANAIETYELSILPYEDCCTVFVPRHPVIKPTLQQAQNAESGLDIETLVNSCLSGITQEDLGDGLGR